MEHVISTVLETLGLGAFLYYLIRGLKLKIVALEETIRVQGQTLDVMERRVVETEKLSNIYKSLLADLPKDLDNFKAVMSKTKDDVIGELQNRNEIATRRLADAQKQIEASKATPDRLRSHLQVLKNLLVETSSHGTRPRGDLELAEVCTYGGHSLEERVALILESATFDEFMVKAGFRLSLTEDIASIIKTTQANKLTPKGAPIRNMRWTKSIGGAYYVMINEEVYVNAVKYSEFKAEFEAVKAK